MTRLMLQSFTLNLNEPSSQFSIKTLPLTTFLFLGLIAAIGISNLQYVNLNSSRNMLVIGLPIMMAMALPEWIENNKDTIKTGICISKIYRLSTICLSLVDLRRGSCGSPNSPRNTIPITHYISNRQARQ